MTDTDKIHTLTKKDLGPLGRNQAVLDFFLIGVVIVKRKPPDTI